MCPYFKIFQTLQIPRINPILYIVYLFKRPFSLQSLYLSKKLSPVTHMFSVWLKKRLKKGLEKVRKSKKKCYFCTRIDRQVHYNYWKKRIEKKLQKKLKKDLDCKEKRWYLCHPQKRVSSKKYWQQNGMKIFSKKSFKKFCRLKKSYYFCTR